MKKIDSLLSIAAIFCLISVAISIPMSGNEIASSPLNDEYQLTKGEAIAMDLNNFLFFAYISGISKAPSYVNYNRNENKIEIAISGGWTSSEIKNAKTVVEKKWSMIKSSILPSLNDKYNISLDKKDFIFYYINRNTGKEILEMKNGDIILK